MRVVLTTLLLVSAAACASHPGRDGPASPARDTTRHPGEATDPMDPLSPTQGATPDSTRVWR